MDLDTLTIGKEPFPNFLAKFKQLAERCAVTDAEKKDLIKRKVGSKMLKNALNVKLPRNSTFEDWAEVFIDYYLS